MGSSPVTLLVAASGLSATTAYADPTTGSIAGHLTDCGTPVANSRVALFDLDFNFIQKTTTDVAGAFGFVDVNPGSHKMSFDLPGGFAQRANQKLDFFSADTITVTAGTETTVDEQVIPHGSISGRVTSADGSVFAHPFVTAFTADFTVFVQTNGDLEGQLLGQTLTIPPIELDRAGEISGVITDKPTGDKLNQAAVGLTSFSNGAGPTQAQTSTDSQGRYTLSNLGPYDWTLFFARHQYAAQFSGGVTNRFPGQRSPGAQRADDAVRRRSTQGHEAHRVGRRSQR